MADNMKSVERLRNEIYSSFSLLTSKGLVEYFMGATESERTMVSDYLETRPKEFRQKFREGLSERLELLEAMVK